MVSSLLYYCPNAVRGPLTVLCINTNCSTYFLILIVKNISSVWNILRLSVYYLFFFFKTHRLTGRKEAPNLRLINFPHPINPPGKNPVNKNGVVYVDLLYRMMSEERHCVMLLMFVYGELSSKKNKQKNVHLLPPKKCVQFLKRKPVSFFCQLKKGKI